MPTFSKPNPPKVKLVSDSRLKLFRPVDKDFPISSPFGMRTLRGKTALHKGYDFACPKRSFVYCMADGFVFRAGFENERDKKQGYGLRIWQRFTLDGEDYFAWYGHLDALAVAEGDRIVRGQVIGRSGNSGSSTGPHLHVGVRKVDTDKFFEIDFEDRV